MKVSFQKYIDKLKTNLSFQKSKVCVVLSYKWLLICMMKTSKQSGDNTQSVHPELKSRLGFFFHSELIICSHSFYIPNIYQSTVYLSLYLSKLNFTVNLTFSRCVIPPQQAHYSWSLFGFFNFLYFLVFFTILFIVSIYFENCIFERRRTRNEIKSFNDYSSVLL